MSIPNVITLFRIALTPIFVRFYLEGQHMTAMALLLLAAVSDMADGFIARRFQMITPLGKVLDPVADKLLQLAMLLCLMKRSHAVLGILLLHLLRELWLLALGSLCFKRSGVLIGARWYGKICTAALYSVLGAALMWPGLPERLLHTGLMLCSGLIIFCLVGYTREYLHILHGDNTIKKPT